MGKYQADDKPSKAHSGSPHSRPIYPVTAVLQAVDKASTTGILVTSSITSIGAYWPQRRRLAASRLLLQPLSLLQPLGLRIALLRGRECTAFTACERHPGDYRPDFYSRDLQKLSAGSLGRPASIITPCRPQQPLLALLQ